jgi:hypothetical protein
MCNCKKTHVQAPEVIVPEPTPIPEQINIPQTPEELHTQEMNKWNGGNNQ